MASKDLEHKAGLGQSNKLGFHSHISLVIDENFTHKNVQTTFVALENPSTDTCLRKSSSVTTIDDYAKDGGPEMV